MDFESMTAAAEAAEHERQAQRLLREAAQRVAYAAKLTADGRQRGFSIVRTVEAAATRGLTDGYEAEVSQELARAAGSHHDPHRPWIPWQALTRTLQAGTTALGGALVADGLGPAQQALFPASTVIRMGAQLLENQKGDVLIPRFSGNASGYWLGELGTATASTPTFAQQLCTPKHVGAFVRLSRRLLQQSAAEQLVGQHLLAVVGAAIDAAALAGTSADNTVPIGIRHTAGVTLSTGTSFSNATAQAMLRAVAEANANDERISFAAPPAVRELLASRASNGTGSRFLWQDNQLASKPAYVNANAPASTLFCADFSLLMLPLWGNGIQLEVNPFEQFTAGVVGMRVFASVDVAVTTPAAFAVSVSVT